MVLLFQEILKLDSKLKTADVFQCSDVFPTPEFESMSLGHGLSHFCLSSSALTQVMSTGELRPKKT